MLQIAAIILLLFMNACAKPQPSVQTFEPTIAAPGDVVQAQKGDTVYSLARRHGVSMRDIISLNNLKPPFQLKTGSPITLPAKETGAAPVIIDGTMSPVEKEAPVTAEPLPPAPETSGQKTYQQIVPVPRASEEELSPAINPFAADHVADEPREKVIYAPVQQDKMNEIAEAAVTQESKAQPGPLTQTLNLQPLQYDKKSKELKPPSFPIKPEIRKQADVLQELKKQPQTSLKTKSAAKAEGRFTWPVQGKVLSSYGPKAGGLRNDGINIGAPRGTPVVASDGGTVAYAGNDIPGYGNVVLIRHPDGWMTTYAHLERFYVQRDAAVAKGDMVGTVGISGGLTVPQLHFEIRQGSEAMNPEKQLGKL